MTAQTNDIASPLHQDKAWLDGPDVDVPGIHAQVQGTQPDQQHSRASSSKRPTQYKSKISKRLTMIGGLTGIAVLAYMQFWPHGNVPDMLGSSLPNVPADVIASALPHVEPVDPRLSDTNTELFDFFGQIEPEASGLQAPPGFEDIDSPVLKNEAESDLVATVVPSAVPSAAPTAQAENAQLLERMQRLELLLGQLQKQLELQAQINANAAALSAANPQSGAMQQATVVATAPKPKPASAPVRKVAKAGPKPTPKPAPASTNVAKAADAPKLSGQLVSVDMWNGQPSVVVASGLTGDRRVRVLRPGDVINGLALRSADPATQSATFAVPGSSGLTLYVSKGG